MLETTVVQDVNGKKSSKRIAGFYCLIVFSVISVIAVIQAPETITSLAWPWAITAGALFGVTVLERKD